MIFRYNHKTFHFCLNKIQYCSKASKVMFLTAFGSVHYAFIARCYKSLQGGAWDKYSFSLLLVPEHWLKEHNCQLRDCAKRKSTYVLTLSIPIFIQKQNILKPLHLKYYFIQWAGTVMKAAFLTPLEIMGDFSFNVR